MSVSFVFLLKDVSAGALKIGMTKDAFFCGTSSQNSILSNHFAKQRSYAKSKYIFTLKTAFYSLFSRSKDPNPFSRFQPIENII